MNQSNHALRLKIVSRPDRMAVFHDYSWPHPLIRSPKGKDGKQFDGFPFFKVNMPIGEDANKERIIHVHIRGHMGITIYGEITDLYEIIDLLPAKAGQMILTSGRPELMKMAFFATYPMNDPNDLGELVLCPIPGNAIMDELLPAIEPPLPDIIREPIVRWMHHQETGFSDEQIMRLKRDVVLFCKDKTSDMLIQFVLYCIEQSENLSEPVGIIFPGEFRPVAEAFHVDKMVLDSNYSDIDIIDDLFALADVEMRLRIVYSYENTSILPCVYLVYPDLTRGALYTEPMDQNLLTDIKSISLSLSDYNPKAVKNELACSSRGLTDRQMERIKRRLVNWPHLNQNVKKAVLWMLAQSDNLKNSVTLSIPKRLESFIDSLAPHANRIENEILYQMRLNLVTGSSVDFEYNAAAGGYTLSIAPKKISDPDAHTIKAFDSGDHYLPEIGQIDLEPYIYEHYKIGEKP